MVYGVLNWAQILLEKFEVHLAYTKRIFNSWWTKNQVSVKSIYYFYFDQSRNVLFSLLAPSIGRQSRKHNPAYAITSSKNASKLCLLPLGLYCKLNGKKSTAYTKIFLVRVSQKKFSIQARCLYHCFKVRILKITSENITYDITR